MELAPAYDSITSVGLRNLPTKIPTVSALPAEESEHSHDPMEYDHLCRDCGHRPAERDGLCTECLNPDDLVYYE